MKATAFRTVPTALIATLAMLYKSLDVFCEDFLILEVLLQSDCCSHREGELLVVHCIPAGVRSKVFLDCLFCNPANSGSQVREHCSIENSLSDTLFMWNIIPCLGYHPVQMYQIEVVEKYLWYGEPLHRKFVQWVGWQCPNKLSTGRKALRCWKQFRPTCCQTSYIWCEKISIH